MRRWLLVGIILLAFFLRLHNLDNFGFWQDEGLTPLRSGYSVAEILSNRVTIQEGVTKDTHPPLFFLILKADNHSAQALYRKSGFRDSAMLAMRLLLR